MKLVLSAQRSDETVGYSRNGYVFGIVTRNGELQEIDLSGDWVKLEPDTDEESLEPTGYLLKGGRDPDTGEITLTVLAPHAANAPESETFPEPITLNDGESVTFPRETIDA